MYTSLVQTPGTENEVGIEVARCWNSIATAAALFSKTIMTSCRSVAIVYERCECVYTYVSKCVRRVG